jgi:hypothetical protein
VSSSASRPKRHAGVSRSAQTLCRAEARCFDSLNRKKVLHMKELLFVLAILFAGSCAAQSSNGKYNFDRFSPELPQLLEMDALTVLVRGVTIEMGSHVCNRTDAANKAGEAVANWKVRNEKYSKAASGAINAFANRIESARGMEAKNSYLSQTLATTAREGQLRVARQFDGPSPENTLAPSREACLRMAEHLNSGRADVEQNPEITVALRQYMAKQEAR